MEFQRSKKPSLSLDMAPLIDVVFLLLVFFMLASSFLQPSLKLKLPKAVPSEEPAPMRLVVSVDANEHIYVNTARVPMEELRAHLETRLAGRKGSERDIHLRGDAEMPYRLFVEIMDRARRAGAGQMNIVHMREEAA